MGKDGGLPNDDLMTGLAQEDPGVFDLGDRGENLHRRRHTELPKRSECGLDSIITKDFVTRRLKLPITLP